LLVGAWGHNEDYTKAFIGKNYMVVAQEDPAPETEAKEEEAEEGGVAAAGTPKAKGEQRSSPSPTTTTREPLRYVAYCYAGCPPGWGPAYTNRGLAFSLNFLVAKKPKVG
jgi:hypothetical protein